MGFEYLDHTADIQIHSFGPTLSESFAQAGYALLHYLTDPTHIEPLSSFSISLQTKELSWLLYKFLDDLLFHFYADIAAHSIRVERIELVDGEWHLEAVVMGDCFDPQKHRCGCEVKAITLSNLSINSLSAPFDIYVILDI